MAGRKRLRFARCKCGRAEHHSIDAHPRPHFAATSVASSALCGRRSSYERALKAAAQSGMPRGLDLLFVGLTQGGRAIVGT
jgi:hypothetical protein